MFHISPDKRSLDSAVCLRRTFGQMLDCYPVDKITVALLCREANVSRTTFYRLFDTPTDIIRWYCDEQVAKLCRALAEQGREAAEWPFRFNLRFILEQPEALEMACKAGRVDIADAAFARRMEPMLEQQRQHYGVDARDLRLSSLVVSSIITSAFRAWLDEGKKEPVEVFHKRIVTILDHIR